MPLKKKRVSAFEVRCKKTFKDEKSKDIQKSDKLQKKHVEVEEVDAATYHLANKKQVKNLNAGNKKKSRKSQKSKRPAKLDSFSPKGVDKMKQNYKQVHLDESEQIDRGVRMVVTDEGHEAGDVCDNTEEKLHGEIIDKIDDLDRLEDNDGEFENDPIDSDVNHNSGNVSKRKISCLGNDKRVFVNKKSKIDLNKKLQAPSSEWGIQETNVGSAEWTDIGRRLQSRAGYDGPVDNGQTSIEDMHKSVRAIPMGDSVLVFVKHPCEVPLKGFVTIEVLIGIASIMGYNLEPGKQGHDVYSPDCNSLVTVSTVKGETNTKNAVSKVDSLLGIMNNNDLNLLKHALNESKPFVVLKFDKLKTTLCSFLSNFHPYTNIFKVDGDNPVLNKQLAPLSVKIPGEEDDAPWLTVPEQLQSVLDVWKQNLTSQNEGVPVILVCGGKSSGKSTTNRMLINKTLNMCESVYYLECDIGQTEFTPPGVLSLVKVTSPVLGPPFTHQRKTVCSYHYGTVSPKDNADLYLRCVQLCVQEYKLVEQKIPLIVNTMGWMKGLGWQLLLDIVRLVSPSIMVQLLSNQTSQNVPPINVGDLKQSSWTDLSMMFKGETIERKMDRIPKFLHLEAPVYTSFNYKLKPGDHRNMTILSHIGADLEPGLTLISKIPFTVSWKDVAIHMCHVDVPRSQVMYALNANMVALCEGDIMEAELYEDDGPLFLKKSKQPFRWISYGLIRGIDMVKKKFYVVTSLSDEDLARVNVLDIGGISLPENFHISQKADRLLYVDEVVESKGLAAVRQRKHMPRKGLRGNIG